MRQIAISELKRLTVPEIKNTLPCEILSDGEVIAEIGVRGKVRTKCPNCGLIYDSKKPDEQRHIMSIRKVR